MSPSIYYQKVSKSNKTLPVMAPSSFINMIERAFGRFPVELGVADLQVLHGILAASSGRDEESIQVLIDQIGDENRIKVWAEY